VIRRDRLRPQWRSRVWREPTPSTWRPMSSSRYRKIGPAPASRNPRAVRDASAWRRTPCAGQYCPPSRRARRSRRDGDGGGGLLDLAKELGCQRMCWSVCPIRPRPQRADGQPMASRRRRGTSLCPGLLRGLGFSKEDAARASIRKTRTLFGHRSQCRLLPIPSTSAANSRETSGQEGAGGGGVRLSKTPSRRFRRKNGTPVGCVRVGLIPWGSSIVQTERGCTWRAREPASADHFIPRFESIGAVELGDVYPNSLALSTDGIGSGRPTSRLKLSEVT